MRLGAYIDISVMPPRPERLAEIGEYLASLELDAVFIEWGTLFPWEFDERVRDERHFTDDTVLGLHRDLARNGIEHIPVLSAANPALLARDPSFSALASDDRDTERCVRRLVVTMLEDMRALLPDLARVCLNGLSDTRRRSTLRQRESRIIDVLRRELELLHLTAVTVDADGGELWSSTASGAPRPDRVLIDALCDCSCSRVTSPEWRLAAIADSVLLARPGTALTDATRIEYERVVRSARAFSAFESALSGAWSEYRNVAEQIASASANRDRTLVVSTEASDLDRSSIDAFERALKRLDDAADALFEATRHGVDAAVFDRRLRVMIEPLREAYESCRSRVRILALRFGRAGGRFNR